MLITKTVIIKWHSRNKKHYVNKGYKFTKMGDKFEVKVEDLTKGSETLVDVQCDCEDCTTPITKPIRWYHYKKQIKKDGKYYCHPCSMKLYGKEKLLKTRLKNGKSFEQWCIDHDRQDVLDRWDYELNDKKPNEITYASGKKYWFKCLEHSKHKSELKSINNFTSGNNGIMDCKQCNSIATTHPHLIKYFVDIEDTKKYSHGSHTKVKIKCPNCGYIENKIIKDFIINNINCPKCGDKKSYPEKFMLNVLEQLNMNFKTQLSKTTFKWCNKYYYDFYFKINDEKYIIETHGLQHYEGGFERKSKKARTLEEEIINDYIKKKTALINGIKEDNYMVIDCRKSDLEWIKNNIMESKLPQLLNFKEEDIDWLKCHEYACNSLVRETCDLWNDKINNVNEIALILKIHRSSVVTYLKQGTKLNWCNYNGEKESYKNLIFMSDKNCKKIICLNTKEVFNSINSAKDKCKIDNSSISKCCRKKQKTAGKDPVTGESLKWMYYDEYIKRLNNKELHKAC